MPQHPPFNVARYCNSRGGGEKKGRITKQLNKSNEIHGGKGRSGGGRDSEIRRLAASTR